MKRKVDSHLKTVMNAVTPGDAVLCFGTTENRDAQVILPPYSDKARALPASKNI